MVVKTLCGLIEHKRNLVEDLWSHKKFKKALSINLELDKLVLVALKLNIIEGDIAMNKLKLQ